MPRKKTADDYKALGEPHGWRWVADAIPGASKQPTKELTDWYCEKHERPFRMSYNRMQSQSQGCPDCGEDRSQAASERQRRKPEDYRALGQEKGWEWLGPEVKSTKKKTYWLCKDHGPFPSKFNCIQQDNGCPECGLELAREVQRKKRLRPGDYHALAELYDWRWLGPEVSRNNALTDWLCSEGHKVRTSYDKVQSRQSCMECSGVAPKTKSDYLDLAMEIGYVFKGPVPKNSREITYWDCDINHFDVDMTYSSLRAGQRCRYCKYEQQAERQRLKEADYRSLAEDRGIEWVGPKLPKNKDDPTYWHCLAGQDHPDWPASYGSIRGGIKQPPSGCPSCADHGINLTAPGLLYYVRVETRNQLFWKIGITNRTVEARFLSDWWKITVLKRWDFDVLRQGYEKEQQILSDYDEFRYTGLETPLVSGGNRELFVKDVLGLDPDN